MSCNDCELRNNRTVSLVYRFLPHYRVGFYEGLRKALADDGVIFNLIYGKNQYVPREDEVDISWGISVRNRVLRIGGHSVLWQSVPEGLYDSDLIIIVQENLILSNHAIIARSLMTGRRVAFWGHGYNHQARRMSLGNLFKRIYSNRVCWWFAYTGGVARTVTDMGFPEDRITVVNNAIDTRRLAASSQGMSLEEISEVKKELRIGNGPVGLFCGGLYREKRLDFVLDACRKIKEVEPNFEMIFVGSGPDKYRVEDATKTAEWIHYVGPKFGDERIPYFKMADVFIMPGLVGLAVLDCFALEVPLVTTKYPYHSPEIEYVVENENGLITENSLDKFVEGVLKVLTSETLRGRLKMGCRQSATVYTMENMVKNFSDGVLKALAAEA
jgi:glycosyltransferase involved in cell wall biosynthesis